MAQEQSHGCKFELQTGFISSRQSPYERVYMTVVEVNGGDSFPFGPAGKSSCNGSLLAKGPFCVTSLAKVLKEWFDLIIKQGRPAGAGCGHEASPCGGIAASRERRYDYAASGTVKNQAGCVRTEGTRHNPGGGIIWLSVR